MTLTPPRFHIADDMPMSLGKAIAEPTPSTEPCKFRAFEKLRLGWVETEPGRWDTITEEDCRQIKGAAKPASREVAPIGRPAEAAPPSVQKFSPGDVVEYIHEWCVENSVTSLSGQRFTVREMGRAGIVNFTDGQCEEVVALRLISPASETETEGWVRHIHGMPCPIPDVCEFVVLWKKKDGSTYEEDRSRPLSPHYWQTSSDGEVIAAYKVLA